AARVVQRETLAVDIERPRGELNHLDLAGVGDGTRIRIPTSVEVALDVGRVVASASQGSHGGEHARRMRDAADRVHPGVPAGHPLRRDALVSAPPAAAAATTATTGVAAGGAATAHVRRPSSAARLGRGTGAAGQRSAAPVADGSTGLSLRGAGRRLAGGPGV